MPVEIVAVARSFPRRWSASRRGSSSLFYFRLDREDQRPGEAGDWATEMR